LRILFELTSHRLEIKEPQIAQWGNNAKVVRSKPDLHDASAIAEEFANFLQASSENFVRNIGRKYYLYF